MINNPFAGGPAPNGTWLSPLDVARADRWNARIGPDDPRRLSCTTLTGRPLVPTQWSGNPWTASIVLLLLNPAPSPHLDEVYRDPATLNRLEASALCRWDEDYPNALLHPSVRCRDPWTANVVFGDLHRYLNSIGMESEPAWRRVAQRCSVLELSPLMSYKWSTSAVVSSTATSIALAAAAQSDPDRLVLLARGESDWRCAGFLDVDVVPKSLGVRSHQCRLSRNNFPTAWDRVVELLTA